jgi:membrane fusion protein, multidrug efflux system
MAKMRRSSTFFALAALAVLAGGAYAMRNAGVWDTAVASLQAPGTAQQAPATASQQTGQPQQGQPGGRPPSPVEVEASKSVTVNDSLSAIGSLVAAESIVVSADTSGRIAGVFALDGKQVAKGTELFRLDGALIDAEVNDAQSRLALAEANFNRTQKLVQSRTTPQSEADRTRVELELALSALALARERQSRLSIRAPFDGHLGFRQVSLGSYVTAGMPLIDLNQLTTLKVSFSVPELFFTSIAVGQAVSITADALPGQTFQAKVSALDPVIDASGRALRIRAEVDNAQLLLRPGMLTRVQVLATPRNAVTVNEAAIVPQGKDAVVFEVKDGKVAKRVVQTGKRSDGWVEITSGLDEGAEVVIAGATRLSDGASVKVANQKSSE